LDSERKSRLKGASELAAAREQLENLRSQLSDVTSLNEQLEIRSEMENASLQAMSAELVDCQLAHRATTGKLAKVSTQLWQSQAQFSLARSSAEAQQAQARSNEESLLQRMALAQSESEAKYAALELRLSAQLEQAKRKIAEQSITGVANTAVAGWRISGAERKIKSAEHAIDSLNVRRQSQAWRFLSDRLFQKRIVKHLSAEVIRCRWLRLVQGIGHLHLFGALFGLLIAMRRHALHCLAEKQAEIGRLLEEPEDPGPPWQRTMGGGFAVRAHRSALSSALAPGPCRANYRGRREELMPAQIQFGLIVQPGGDERDDSPSRSSPLHPAHYRPSSAFDARKRQSSPPKQRPPAQPTASSIPSGKVCRLCKHSVFSLLQQSQLPLV
jgi:hypothetical protein